MPKDGRSRCKRTYRCGDCKYRTPPTATATSTSRIMDMDRLERKPAGSYLPASVGKIRGINADKPEVKTVSFDEMWTYLGVRRGENRRSVWI